MIHQETVDDLSGAVCLRATIEERLHRSLAHHEPFLLKRKPGYEISPLYSSTLL